MNVDSFWVTYVKHLRIGMMNLKDWNDFAVTNGQALMTYVVVILINGYTQMSYVGYQGLYISDFFG